MHAKNAIELCIGLRRSTKGGRCGALSTISITASGCMHAAPPATQQALQVHARARIPAALPCSHHILLNTSVLFAMAAAIPFGLLCALPEAGVRCAMAGRQAGRQGAAPH